MVGRWRRPKLALVVEVGHCTMCLQSEEGWKVRGGETSQWGLDRVWMMMCTRVRRAENAGLQASPDEQWAREGMGGEDEWSDVGVNILPLSSRRGTQKKKKKWNARIQLKGSIHGELM